MSFPIVTNSGTSTAVQFGTGLLYSNVFYFVAGRTAQVYSFTVPAGITTIRARVWGGGGGGGTYSSGGGGGFSIRTVTVTPGNTFNITAGEGGNSSYSSGGNSSFGSFVSATGGLHGDSARTGGSGSGGDKNSNGQGGNSTATTGGFYGAYAGNYFVSYTLTGGDSARNIVGIDFLPSSSPANQLDLIGTAGVFKNHVTTGGRGGQLSSAVNSTQPNGTAPGGGGSTDSNGNPFAGGGGLVVIEY